MAKSPKIYLSYSREDVKAARELVEELRARRLDVFFQEEIPVGENWAMAVGKALSRSDSMIVLVSPSAMRSEAVRKELDFAITGSQFDRRLVPVILRTSRDMPWILEKLYSIDARKDWDAARVAEEVTDALAHPREAAWQ